MCVVDVRVYLRSSVGILDEALDLTADLCTALFLQRTQVASEMTSSQLASHTIFTSVKVTWVLQGSLEGATAELFRTFQGVIVPERPAGALLYAKQKSAVTSNTSTTHPQSGHVAESPILIRQPNEPCRQTLLLHGRPRLSHREHHWIAPMRLTAAQPGPWLRPVKPTAPLGTNQNRPGRASGHPTHPRKSRNNQKRIPVAIPTTKGRTETQEGSKGPQGAPRLSRP